MENNLGSETAVNHIGELPHISCQSWGTCSSFDDDDKYFPEENWLPSTGVLERQPSHALVKQSRSSILCALFALINCLDNVLHLQRILGTKRKFRDFDDKITDTDFEEVEFVLRKELGIKTKGYGPADLWMFFHAMQGPRDLNLQRWVFKRRLGMDVLNLILFDVNKCGNSYILFGRTTSDSVLRRKSSNFLLMRTGNRTSPFQRQDKLMKRKVLDKVREAEAQWKKRSFGATSRNSQPHAICVKFNAFGVPFRYDPGKEKPICLYNEEGKLETWGDYCDAVEKLTDSLFVIEKVYRFQIVFNKENVVDDNKISSGSNKRSKSK